MLLILSVVLMCWWFSLFFFCCVCVRLFHWCELFCFVCFFQSYVHTWAYFYDESSFFFFNACSWMYICKLVCDQSYVLYQRSLLRPSSTLILCGRVCSSTSLASSSCTCSSHVFVFLFQRRLFFFITFFRVIFRPQRWLL